MQPPTHFLTSDRPLGRAWWAVVRFGFRLLYNELAFTYDPVSYVVSLGQWRAWQRCAVPHLHAAPGDPVLELAHGTGHLQIALRAAGYRPAALDLSRAMGRLAQRTARSWGFQPALVRARAQALPFRQATFRAVVSTFPTEFIADPATLAEIRRVLIPGGRLVVVLGGVLTGSSPATAALEAAYRVTGQRGPWPIDVRQRLADAGFTGEVVTETLPRSVVFLLLAE